jgi:hypothetical protein
MGGPGNSAASPVRKGANTAAFFGWRVFVSVGRFLHFENCERIIIRRSLRPLSRRQAKRNPHVKRCQPVSMRVFALKTSGA